MSIQAADLKRMVKNLLKFFEEVLTNEKIDRIYEFELLKDVEMKFKIIDSPNDYISLMFRPSSRYKEYTTSLALTISYIMPGHGVPLEVRVNRSEGYSRIILKTNVKLIPGYKIFAIDNFDNIYQDKVLPSAHASQIKEELQNLLKQLE